MFKLLLASMFLLCSRYTDSKSCTNLPFSNIPYCEKLTEFMTGYECVDEKCRKTVTSCEERQVCLQSLNVCKLTCGQKPIWPLPTGDTCISKALDTFPSSTENFHTTINGPPGSQNCKRFNALMKGVDDQIKDHVLAHGLPATSDKRKVIITIEVQEVSIQLTDDTDESYILYLSSHTGNIYLRILGKTFFGVRNGMETLLQLIVYDDKSESLMIPMEVTVIDKPEYSYRGLMLDTARNYFPIEDIKRTLDAMAMNKMNTFHWHMTDIQSFPYVSRKYSGMAVIGAYSSKEVYNGTHIREVVEHARSRGIRVIPELATPSNVGEGWQKFIDQSTKNKYLTCYNKSWSDVCNAPACGQLDPTASGIYHLLGDLYKEFARLFDSNLFHMGVFGINAKCWELPHIEKWKPSKEYEGQKKYVALWAYFQERSLQKLKESNRKISRAVIWSSKLTENPNITQFAPPDKYIIQFDDITKNGTLNIVAAGYSLIVSSFKPYYLACGLGNWTTDGQGWCGTYKTWHQLYMADPANIIFRTMNVSNNATIRRQILGSEATAYSHMIDAQTLDSHIWPRVAALAERLWSNPKTGWREAKSRLSYHRYRMVTKGIGAEALEPFWCLQNDGKCIDPDT